MKREEIKDKFQLLLDEGERILDEVGWDGYQYRDYPSVGDYHQFHAATLDIVREAHGEESNYYRALMRLPSGVEADSYYFKDCFRLLQVARQNFESDQIES